MKIDIVYTWVDGSDPAWNQRKIDKAKLAGKVLVESNSEARFMDNQELKYSLRSIEKYAPWVNKIFIVTDKQCPEWLNLSNPKIKIIDHTEIFTDTSVLPTYHSRGIEAQLHHIEELSEHFIYFNDDMFLGNKTTPNTFFIKEGSNRVFVSEIIPIPNKKSMDISYRPLKDRNDHQYAIVKTRRLIRDKFNKSIYSNIRHGAIPLIKSVLYKLEELYKEDFTELAANSFRTEDDMIVQHLFDYYSIIQGFGKRKYLRTVSSRKNTFDLFSLFNSQFTFGYINLHDKSIDSQLTNMKHNKPFMICLNQTPDTPQQNIGKIKKFLEEYYPEKSSFEK